MAKRSYVPRHAAAPEPAAPVARKAVTVLAASVGVAAATTALANPADAQTRHPMGAWDRVASCESGQDWQIDTGNGYYGGLQFSASTWRAYHGEKYAGTANNATRMEQIQVARRVLAAQGVDAWPVCGPRAGLTQSNGYATSSALPNDANTLPSSARFRAKTRHLSKVHRSAHKSHHSAHGSHHVAHKSRAHGDVYTVRRGDTLSLIATRHHVRGGWPALFRANRNHMSNPNLLRVGQHLLIP